MPKTDQHSTRLLWRGWEAVRDALDHHLTPYDFRAAEQSTYVAYLSETDKLFTGSRSVYAPRQLELTFHSVTSAALEAAGFIQ